MYNIVIKFNHAAAAPPSKKKPKLGKDKRSKGEKAMERAIESFIKYQNETEESYRKWEEERWEKELELDEKRRKENQEHEIRLFQMLGQMVRPRESYPASPYNFDYEY